MTKAKTIDRIELTRQKFNRESYNDNPADEHFGLCTCPNCGQLTLIHEGGCEHCTNCGWSACS